MDQRCASDGADLVSLNPDRGGYEYLFCPMCSTAILALGRLRIRYRYRMGDLFLLEMDDPRARVHLEPFRAAIAQFLRAGLPFHPLCSLDGARVPILLEAERVKLVWCASCKAGTAYCARPRYGWTLAGTFGIEGDKYALRDYRGPDDLYALIESTVTSLPGSRTA